MVLWKRNFKFWALECLKKLGLIAVVSLLIMIFFALRGFGEAEDVLIGTLQVYPIYLFLTGGFVIVIVVISYFQLTLPTLLSFNATRRGTVFGLMLMVTGVILGIMILSGIIWMALPAKGLDYNLSILGGGLLFGIAALGLFLGAVIVSWGRFGVILLVGVLSVAGAAFGMGVVGGAKALKEGFYIEFSFSSFIIIAAGILLYLVAGIFTMLVTRKLEVKI